MNGYDVPWICAKLPPCFLAFLVVNVCVLSVNMVVLFFMPDCQALTSVVNSSSYGCKINKFISFFAT